jgi:hypothetical protein
MSANRGLIRLIYDNYAFVSKSLVASVRGFNHVLTGGWRGRRG